MASGKGAIAGAGTGAAIGSFFPGIGTGIGAGLGALLGLFGTGGGKDAKPSPELQRIYEQELERMNAQNPLVEAAYRLAFSRLPDAARTGLAEPNLDQSWAALPMVNDAGDYDEPFQVRQALRMMEVRQRMANPIIQAVTRMAMSRLPTAFQARAMPTTATGPNGQPEFNETGDLERGYSRGRI